MSEKKADLILFGGKVYTFDAAGTEPSAIAVSEGQILAVGSDDEIVKLAGPEARKMHLAGAVVLPGLIDSHFHAESVGQVSQMTFLYDARSVAEIVARLKEHAKKTSGLIIGRGGNFHPTSLAEGRLPTAADLDSVATDRPVMITDVNKTIVNSFVLRDIDTDDVPPGGEVPKDASGQPLGIFCYAAKAMTPIGGQGDVSVTDISQKKAILRGLECGARMGLTGVLDALGSLASIAALRAIDGERGLPIRVSVMPCLGKIELAGVTLGGIRPTDLEEIDASHGLNEGRLTFGPAKLLFDCMIMHRTALMYEPYVGHPDNLGMSWISEEVLQQQIDEAFDAGWPVGIHTTGARGTDIVASAIEKGIEKAGGAPGRCHLIHAYWTLDKPRRPGNRQSGKRSVACNNKSPLC